MSRDAVGVPVDSAPAVEPVSSALGSSSSQAGRSIILLTLPFVLLIFMLTSALLTAGGQWRGLPYPDPSNQSPPPVIPAKPSENDWGVRVFNFLTWFTQFTLSISCYYPIMTLLFHYRFRPLRSDSSFLMIPSALHRYTILLYTASTASHVFSMVGLWLTVETMVSNGTPIRMWYQQILRLFHVNLAGQSFLLPYEIEPVLSDVIFAFHDFVVVLFVWLLPTALVQHQLARHNRGAAKELPLQDVNPMSSRGNSRQQVRNEKSETVVKHEKPLALSYIGSQSCRRLIFLLLCGIPLVICLLALAIAAIVLSTMKNAPFPLPNLFYVGEAFSYVLAATALWVQARYHGDHKSHSVGDAENVELGKDGMAFHPSAQSYRKVHSIDASMHKMDESVVEGMSDDGGDTTGKRAVSRHTNRQAVIGVPLGATWSDLPCEVQVEVHRLVAVWAFLLFFGFLLRTIAMGYRPAKGWVPLAVGEKAETGTSTVVSATTLRVLVNIFILLLPAAYVTVQRTVLFYGRRWLVGSQTRGGGVDILRMNTRGFFPGDTVRAWEDPDALPTPNYPGRRILTALRSSSQPGAGGYREGRGIPQPSPYASSAAHAGHNPSYGLTDRSSTMTLEDPPNSRFHGEDHPVVVNDASVGSDIQISHRRLKDSVPGRVDDSDSSPRTLTAKGVFA